MWVKRNERSECSEPRGGRPRPADVAAAVLLGEVNFASNKRRTERPEGEMRVLRQKSNSIPFLHYISATSSFLYIHFQNLLESGILFSSCHPFTNSPIYFFFISLAYSPYFYYLNIFRRY